MNDIGRYDLICSCFSMHEWKDPRRVVMQLRSILAPGGSMLLRDLRRIPWLTWLPLRLPMLESIRASDTVEEVRKELSRLPDSDVTVQADAPFMLTVKIRATGL
ncbi:MAG: class I SAM-dependent methyltransferase [Bacteroidia bacterium]|nr:class I SAM-dependent methyltransferase [Bacteroidia bacterium]